MQAEELLPLGSSTLSSLLLRLLLLRWSLAQLYAKFAVKKPLWGKPFDVLVSFFCMFILAIIGCLCRSKNNCRIFKTPPLISLFD
jgi:hypothetical protein